MSEIDVDTDAVRRYAPDLGSVADDLSDALSTLVDALGADDKAWGGDKYGDAFHQQYAKPASAARTGTEQVVRGIRRMRDTLTTAADNYDATEHANTFGT